MWVCARRVGVCTNKSMGPDIIANSGGLTHTLSVWSGRQWNCSVDSICGSMGWQQTQWGADQMCQSAIGLGWWYWEAVYYNFQKGPSCLSSASLSAKLAVLQLFMDTHRLFLPTDFSQTAWNEILCLVEILGSVRRTITSSHCRGRDFLMVTKNCTGAVGTHREATLIPSA